MSNIHSDKRLFLDDMRQPSSVNHYLRDDVYYLEWDVVRNYNDFKNWIDSNGIPLLVSFDHDLHREHIKWFFDNGGHDNPPDPQTVKFENPTGYECALYLIEYCRTNGLSLPDFKVHSKNPIGKENILKLLINGV